MGHIRAPRFWPLIAAVTCGCDSLWQRIGAWVTMSPSGRLPLVSAYAFDPDRRHVVVVWPATVGSLAHVIVDLDATVADEDAGALCGALNRLSRALYSTDASVYQIQPLGVVIPKTREDILRALSICRRLRCPITMRGATFCTSRSYSVRAAGRDQPTG